MRAGRNDSEEDIPLIYELFFKTLQRIQKSSPVTLSPDSVRLLPAIFNVIPTDLLKILKGNPVKKVFFLHV